ncbi:MAG: hypothetical protein JSV17_11425 [Candidatus Aminicenantes bacterium]|nr:MAG: hypothetical protein JSV17_11425 [Candidatus Aminicenantes bacterium]
MRKRLLFLCLLLCTPVFLTGSTHQELEKGTVIPKVICKDNPEHSYALYLPSAYTPEKEWPILYALDPGARGHIPVELFLPAAEEYNYILAGSNNSRNGPWQQVIQALIILWNDTREQFSIDKKRIYVTGFSGGSRGASIFSRVIMHPVAGIIGCGAGIAKSIIKPEQIKPAYYLGIVGITDFNYREMAMLKDQLEQQDVAHRLIIHKGGHDWPPAKTCLQAIEWLEIIGMQKNIRPKDDELVTKIYEKELAEARSFELIGEFSRALSAYQIMAPVFEEWVDTNELLVKIMSIQRNEEYKEETREENRIQEQEMQHLRKFNQLFNQIDNNTPPLKNIERIISSMGLNALRVKADDKTEDKEYAMAIRLLWGLEIDAGSKGWDFFQKGELPKAIFFFEIAAQGGSRDSQRKKNIYYFLASAYARIPNKKKALSCLRLAFENGFDNIQHLEQDEDFTLLKKTEEYGKILKTFKRKINSK